MTRGATVLLMLILAGPATAGEAPQILEDERLSEVKGELEALFEGLAEAKLPEELFVAKIREGLVKKVEAKKILAALEKLEIRCRKAVKILASGGYKASASSTGYAAELMGLGAGEEQVRSLVAGLAKAKADVAFLDKALVVAIMMVEAGTPAGEAVDEVLGIVEKDGQKGLDAWIEKQSKSGTKTGKVKTSPGGPKGKPGHGKSSGKAKSPGKSQKHHGK